jgi:hypothetical protein
MNHFLQAKLDVMTQVSNRKIKVIILWKVNKELVYIEERYMSNS